MLQRTPSSMRGEPRRASARARITMRNRPWRFVGREVALIGAAALLYSLVHGVTDERLGLAFDNAVDTIDFERALGIFIEPELQQAVVGSDVAIGLANGIYISYWPIIIGTLAWLLIWHPSRYPRFRNAMLISGALSLVIFALFPLAPPRFMPGYGFVDTIASNSTGYRHFNASPLVNEYAAMPSLHVGWVLLVGVAVVTIARAWPIRIAGALAPLAMLAAVVLTANHYILDGLVGGAVVLTGFGAATVIERRRDHTMVEEQQERESLESVR